MNHGTTYTYLRLNCRCEPCTAAMKASNARYNKKRKPREPRPKKENPKRRGPKPKPEPLLATLLPVRPRPIPVYLNPAFRTRVIDAAERARAGDSRKAIIEIHGGIVLGEVIALGFHVNP